MWLGSNFINKYFPSLVKNNSTASSPTCLKASDTLKAICSAFLAIFLIFQLDSKHIPLDLLLGEIPFQQMDNFLFLLLTPADNNTNFFVNIN